MSGYDFYYHIVGIAEDFFQLFLDFFNSLTTPLITFNTPGTMMEGLLSVLSLFGVNLSTTSLLSFLIGLGIFVFVIWHFVKFLVK